jgi:hypothetical protein
MVYTVFGQNVVLSHSQMQQFLTGNQGTFKGFAVCAQSKRVKFGGFMLLSNISHFRNY